MSAGAKYPLFPPPVDEQPWYVVDLQGFDRAGGCGPDCPPEGRRQRVEGLAGPVAAWLRAQADLLDPPRQVMRTRDIAPGQEPGPWRRHDS